MRTKTWTLSDEFWEKIQDEIPTPPREREAGRAYQRKPGAGRKRLDPRQVLEGILYVLRTGCQWNAVPKEYGSSSSLHRYFQAWTQAGFFERIWMLGLQTYDEMEGIGWEWQSLDGNLVKAPLALEAVGKNPTDRGKKRNQTQCLGGSVRLASGDRDRRSEPA
jgi:transposase